MTVDGEHLYTTRNCSKSNLDSVLKNSSENADFYMFGPSGFWNLTRYVNSFKSILDQVFRARSNVPIFISFPHFFDLHVTYVATTLLFILLLLYQHIFAEPLHI